jgi:hypothetical protein
MAIFGASSLHPKIPFPAGGLGVDSSRTCGGNSDVWATRILVPALQLLQIYSERPDRSSVAEGNDDAAAVIGQLEALPALEPANFCDTSVSKGRPWGGARLMRIILVVISIAFATATAGAAITTAKQISANHHLPPAV